MLVSNVPQKRFTPNFVLDQKRYLGKRLQELLDKTHGELYVKACWRKVSSRYVKLHFDKSDEKEISVEAEWNHAYVLSEPLEVGFVQFNKRVHGKIDIDLSYVNITDNSFEIPNFRDQPGIFDFFSKERLEASSATCAYYQFVKNGKILKDVFSTQQHKLYLPSKVTIKPVESDILSPEWEIHSPKERQCVELKVVTKERLFTMQTFLLGKMLFTLENISDAENWYLYKEKLSSILTIFITNVLLPYVFEYVGYTYDIDNTTLLK